MVCAVCPFILFWNLKFDILHAVREIILIYIINKYSAFSLTPRCWYNIGPLIPLLRFVSATLTVEILWDKLDITADTYGAEIKLCMRDWEPDCKIALGLARVVRRYHFKYGFVVLELYNRQDELANGLGPRFCQINQLWPWSYIRSSDWKIANNQLVHHNSKKNKYMYIHVTCPQITIILPELLSRVTNSHCLAR